MTLWPLGRVFWAGKIAQRVKELAVISDELSSVPETYMEGENWLLRAVFWLPKPHSLTQINKCKYVFKKYIFPWPKPTLILLICTIIIITIVMITTIIIGAYVCLRERAHAHKCRYARARVEIPVQPWMLAPPFCFLWETALWSPTTCTRLPDLVLFCLCLTPHHRNAGVTAAHYFIWLCIGSGSLNSGLHTPVTGTLPTEPPL